jgi:hypothetical protein
LIAAAAFAAVATRTLTNPAIATIFIMFFMSRWRQHHSTQLKRANDDVSLFYNDSNRVLFPVSTIEIIMRCKKLSLDIITTSKTAIFMAIPRLSRMTNFEAS